MRRTIVLLFCSALFVALPLLVHGTASAAPQGKLVYWVMADLLFTDTTVKPPILCVQTNVYKPGDEVVFRARVVEVATGQDPGAAGQNQTAIQERDLKVIAYLENGLSFPLKYGQHPPRPAAGDPVQWLWTGAWKIPNDYPAGKLKWWVVVTDKSGAFVRFDPIGAGTNLPAAVIIIEKR